MSECEVVSEESALLNGSEGRILSFLKDLYLTEIRWKHFLHTWASIFIKFFDGIFSTFSICTQKFACIML